MRKERENEKRRDEDVAEHGEKQDAVDVRGLPDVDRRKCRRPMKEQNGRARRSRESELAH